jgi:hypothetical protein
VNLAPAEALSRLLKVLDRLEIHYMVGGSTASSIHGHIRLTKDVDILARVRTDDSELLAEELRHDFYVDAGQIRTAIDHGRAFNIIHLATSYKFDIFPLTSDAYHQVQFARRRFERSTLFGAEPIELAVATPEDVILSKLRWYRLGGETSEQQWNDVLGVISVKRDELDLAYLREWARYLKVDDLLEQSIAERHEPL